MSQSLKKVWQKRNSQLVSVAAMSLIIVLLVLYIIFKIFTAANPVSGAVSSANSKKLAAAQNSASAFYTDMQQQQYAAAYELLSPQQQKQLTQYSFILFAKEIDVKSGKILTFSISLAQFDSVTPSNVDVTIQVTRAQEGKYTIQLQEQQNQNGTWQILQENGPF